MNEDPLSPTVRHLFASLSHAGAALDEPRQAQDESRRVVEGQAGRERLGTRVRFTLILGDGAPPLVRYHAYGCPHTLAVCEWLAREVEAGRAGSVGGPRDWCRTLGIPIMKLGRLLVVEDALKAALSAIGR